MISGADSSPPLFGLVLTGGKSKRMGRDKASLQYGGIPQSEACFKLLSRFCAQVFLSNRADQADAPGHKGFPQLHDAFHDIGPLGGILTALQAKPKTAWLVVACDLPYLDDATLSHLVAHRAPSKLATAFTSAHDGLPEPLCAIYEPHSFEPLKTLLDNGLICPRKALIQLGPDVELLVLPNARALDNVNSPNEYEAALQEKSAASKRIHVYYYAMLRETIGRPSETVETRAQTAQELFEELRGRYDLRWPTSRFRVAINDSFADWLSILKPDDTVSFIPPVAGGC